MTEAHRAPANDLALMQSVATKPNKNHFSYAP
jgi:hypothetical protein